MDISRSFYSSDNIYSYGDACKQDNLFCDEMHIVGSIKPWLCKTTIHHPNVEKLLEISWFPTHEKPS